VQRRFRPVAPNRLRGADFTYVSTWSGMVYVAFVIDAYARRILGWRAASNMRTELVLDAIGQAVWVRRRDGADLAGLVHHTDSETVRAGVLRVPDSHTDGRDRMLVPGAPRAS
jgi:putative transposase